MPSIRLQKYLSQCGVASRRASEKLIEDGLVCINRLLAKVGDSIDPEKDDVTIKGRSVKPKEQKIYIALNKPQGYISSCSRQQGAAIIDLVKIPEKVFPVGRLDKDSEGLVLLTNDGELANKLTHPKYECEKEYVVTVHADVNDAELDSLRKGVLLEEGKTKPCGIKRIGKREFSITLKEGKKRQIRRMFQAAGKKVTKLRRVRIKTLKLGDLGPGKWRHLEDGEITALKH